MEYSGVTKKKVLICLPFAESGGKNMAKDFAAGVYILFL